MKTRKTLFSHHGIIEDGAFVAIVLLVCHMIAVCQCQRPFTNGSQIQTLQQLQQLQQQQNGAVKQQPDSYLYDNDVVRLFDPNLMTTTNGDGSVGGATSGSASGTGETSGSPPKAHHSGKSLGKPLFGGNRGKASDGQGSAGSDAFTKFDINYPAVPLPQSGASGGNNDTQRDTFRELRKNLKEQRKQWDRQGDDPEQVQDHLKMVKERLLKSDVSKSPFSILYFLLSFEADPVAKLINRFCNQFISVYHYWNIVFKVQHVSVAADLFFSID